MCVPTRVHFEPDHLSSTSSGEYVCHPLQPIGPSFQLFEKVLHFGSCRHVEFWPCWPWLLDETHRISTDLLFTHGDVKGTGSDRVHVANCRRSPILPHDVLHPSTV